MNTFNQMPPGTEMDKAVAKAIGLTQEGSYHVGRGWNPSTDWNAAMEAAERFGLFDYMRTRQRYSLAQNCGGGDDWAVIFYKQGKHPFFDVLAEAPTGPLAISRAILHLHHAKH